MDRQRVHHRHAYLLHQRPYGDTSAIVEAFVREDGRVGLVAKGVRGGRSRRQGVLQPFGELLLSWTSRGELATLTEVEAAETPRMLTGTRLISGFYLNELLMRLLRRDDPHPELYDDYRRALLGLASTASERYVLRIFEKRLLEHLGYGLLLEHDASGAPVDPEAVYRYRPEEGPELTAQPGKSTISGHALLALAQESSELATHERELRGLLREALAPHLGPQPLRSRDLYRQFRRPPPSQEEPHEQG
jgi:DNA repair protein RecO (recombination protein O)